MTKKKKQLQKGKLYIVKALDHFTRMNSKQENLYIQFIGYFIEETDNYYKFCSYLYEEYTPEKEIYSNEIRFVVKCAITQIIKLPVHLTGKFDERIFDSTQGWLR